MCPDKDKETGMHAFNFNVEEVTKNNHQEKEEPWDIWWCKDITNALMHTNKALLSRKEITKQMTIKKETATTKHYPQREKYLLLIARISGRTS
jgi:hypothetical protein